MDVFGALWFVPLAVWIDRYLLVFSWDVVCYWACLIACYFGVGGLGSQCDYPPPCCLESLKITYFAKFVF